MFSDAISFLVGIFFSKWSFFVLILCFFAYKWSIATYDTFEKRGLKFIPPIPFFGNSKHMILQTKNFADALNEMYNYFPAEKFHGMFEMRRPVFFIRDPELIKQLTVKDFDHFLDHRLNIDENHEPLFGRNLLTLKGQKWRDMRSTLSPAFTGSKMRTMFHLVSECCSETMNYLEKESKGGKPTLTNLKDLFSRFTTDVIASCSFGIKVDSLRNRDNQFFLYGKEGTDLSRYRTLAFFLLMMFPKFCKIFRIHIFTQAFCNFFRTLVWDTIHLREKENIVRPDMINLLIQARKGKLKYEDEEDRKEGFSFGEAIHHSKLADDDLTAQCLIFFLAGFETTSTCMCFTAYELAVNPEVQKKLLAEVDDMNEMLGGEPISYDALLNMKYLDMVISESLRKWPATVATDRQCVKPYTIETDEISCEVKVGEAFLVPIISLHHDPKFFPNPSRFDPERFSDENKDKITPFTYLPFGVGPRICIGSRFALMETKAIIYNILTKFTFEVSEKTQIPIKLTKTGFFLKPEKGFWVDLKPRFELLCIAKLVIQRWYKKKEKIHLSSQFGYFCVRERTSFSVYRMIGCAISCLAGLVFSKWSLLAGILGYFTYKWSIATYKTFEERGVKFVPPLPLVGNFKHLVFQTKSFNDAIQEMYDHFPREKFFGIFEMRRPIFLLRDPKMIKQMAVKDFDHFLDHRLNLEEKHDPLFGRNLLSLKGQKWRDMRSTLSPAFTGSKMRTMFQLVSECCSETVNYLEKESKGGKPMLTDLKDLFTRFTNDVIATCAFGIKVDSFNDKENEFYQYGKSATDFSGFRSLFFFLMVSFPKFSKAVGIKLFSEKFSTFFRKLVWDTIRYRERENIVRPDMINLLIQARKGKLKHEDEEMDNEGYATVQETTVGEAIHQSKLEEDDLTAQCLIFFLAGFDTSSTCMCFTAHELAANPDVQKKLIEEVDVTKKMLGGKPITYEVLHNMKYLDMVISESLRYWPPAAVTDRKCVKPYTMQVDGKSYDVKVEEAIMIPMVCLHHDPKYFPNPSRFDPERFSDENKDKITPFTYLPFGVGPRNCIGSRFALMETKAIIYYILTKFTFEVSKKTQIPLKLAKAGFAMKPENGFWVNLKPRS
ncbi:uncharacterized protein LOC132258517 [Phlebotomus argentipes]|uniref:uncharacterized protein LOC132258517 n=1 Tax=Phlebotomus argentipes TaxID=94469 RepID=UPI0028933674|nr:uncharacterized protein LOC132258517 [Phlebotomus argentipes]